MTKRILVKYENELKERRKAHSQLCFCIGNRLCKIGKIKEGRRYILKAILLYPLCVRYYVNTFGSFFGAKYFIYFSKVKRYFVNIIIKILAKFKSGHLLNIF